MYIYGNGNTITGNDFTGYYIGLWLGGGSNNIVSRNTIHDTGRRFGALYITSNTSGSKIYNNNFRNNFGTYINDRSAGRIGGSGSPNVFNLSKANGGGNCFDIFDQPGEGCNDGDSDGFCDSGYGPNSRVRNARDNFPLTQEVSPAPSDDTPPVVTVPADITEEATSPAGDVVSFSASAEDDVDGAITPTCAPPSGATFALGATEVTSSATDEAGNTGSASFTVTVEDTTPPVVTPPGPLTVECTSQSGISHTDPAVQPWLASASATDIVDGSVPVTNDALGACALGETTVTFSSTDAAKNTGTASSTLTVEDNTAPTINSASAGPSVLWPPNHKMRAVTVTVDVSDACDANPSCKITAISSNEDENGNGDGNTAPDYEITGDLTADLRAKRSGNASTSTVEVNVPHNQGNGKGKGPK